MTPSANTQCVCKEVVPVSKVRTMTVGWLFYFLFYVLRRVCRAMPRKVKWCLVAGIFERSTEEKE